jgi:hypothetical protein
MAASDILGLFTTPQQYERQRQAAMEAQALQTARLSPMEQGQYGIALGAQQLGRAIGGALGGVDPQLQKITQRQQLLGMIDPNNPDSYAQAIQTALQAGDQEAAFLLRNEMMRLQEQASVAENRRFEREGRLLERGLDMQKRGMESMALSIANGIDPETGDPIKPLFDPITRTFNQDVADQLISRFPTVGADIVKTSLESVQGIVSLQEKQAAKKQEEQAQEKSKLLFKEDGTIDQNVYDDLLALGQVGQTAIDRVLKGRESIKSMQAQQLALGLRNPDGTRNITIENQLARTPEGRAVLKQLMPETKVFKRNDIITEINPITGKYEIVTPEGLKEVPVGENPIIAMIDAKAIDPTVTPFAQEIANQWGNLDDKGRADYLESLTKVNNAALDRNQRKAEASVGGSNKVQSSTTTPDGTTILVMKDGTTEVVSAQGVKLQGQDRANAIKKSLEYGAEIQRMRAQERGLGDFTAKQVNQAFAQIGKIKTNIRNIDQAIDAIDKGANTGVIASRFPNLTAASIQLANIRNTLGLDVIGSVTFGALSEGELNLALETALPTSLSPKDLKVYLEKKKTAQTKLAGYLSKQVTYLSKPGNTLAGWLEKVDNEAGSAPSELPAGVTVKRKN